MRVILTLLAALSIATPALAQENCRPVDKVEAGLDRDFHETRIQQGVTEDGKYMLVIYASPEGKTWTAVILRADGMACLAAAGMDWQERKDEAPVVEEGL